jgi:putative peptidoglycan lipid II flippase
VRAALGAGIFSWDNTRLTAAVLAALALAMVAGAVQTLLTRAFYALGNTWIPLTVNAAASLVSIGFAVFFVRAFVAHGRLAAAMTALFRIADMPHPEAVGLGLGFAAGLVLDATALYVLVLFYARRSLGASVAPVVADGVKIAAAACLAGVVAYLVRINFSDAVPLITWTRVVAEGAIAATAGFCVYFGALALAGSRDVALIRRAAARRLFSLRILPLSWGTAGNEDGVG